MINLKDYAEALRNAVAVENDKDENWRWGLKIISESVAHIKWTYLEYLEEKNSFTITSDSDITLGDCLTARCPDGELIDYVIVGGKYRDVPTAERGVELIVQRIADYAHSRY